ncbi:MAG: FHA domain-containing protein [Phototrophicaceae bacterium]
MSDDQNQSESTENKEFNETILDAADVGNLGETTGFSSHGVQTAMLNDPDLADPMIEREADSDSIELTDGWKIQFKIGDQKKTLPLKTRITVGRAVESDANADEINFDLTPFGAYHFGVSRHHAVMILKEGGLYLEDLGSTNGTRINGFQLTAKQRYRLRHTDEIEFARLRTNIEFKAPDNQ